MVIIKSDNIWNTWSNYQKSDLIHNFVVGYADRNAKRIDYGTGEFYTPVEVHILEKIYLHPGVTVTEIAHMTGRTKSAISQIVSKLESKDLITKTVQEAHGKKQSLQVTANGKNLSESHIKYDDEHTEEFFGRIKEYYTPEEIDAFFRVMETLSYMLNPYQNKKR